MTLTLIISSMYHFDLRSGFSSPLASLRKSGRRWVTGILLASCVVLLVLKEVVLIDVIVSLCRGLRTFVAGSDFVACAVLLILYAGNLVDPRVSLCRGVRVYMCG